MMLNRNITPYKTYEFMMYFGICNVNKQFILILLNMLSSIECKKDIHRFVLIFPHFKQIDLDIHNKFYTVNQKKP